VLLRPIILPCPLGTQKFLKDTASILPSRFR